MLSNIGKVHVLLLHLQVELMHISVVLSAKFSFLSLTFFSQFQVEEHAKTAEVRYSSPVGYVRFTHFFFLPGVLYGVHFASFQSQVVCLVCQSL
jgi:hypothetical protein